MHFEASPKPSHLIITVHGIRTFASWQERLGAAIQEKDPSIEFRHYTYGYFSALAFVIPFTRWITTRSFRHRLLTLVGNRQWDRIDIVAHSFGTHLVAWGLAGIHASQRPRIHTVILAGSVLKSSFQWDVLLADSVKRLVNDCGTKDSILLLNQLVVLFTGMAGRLGFHGMTGENFKNRFFAFGHSGYFLKGSKPNDDFMRTKWLPLLTTNEPIESFDERRTVTAMQGVLVFALNNAEPIKVSAYVIPLLLLIAWLFAQWREAVAVRLAVQSLAAEEREPDLAMLLGTAAHSQSGNKQALDALLTTLQRARWIKSYLRGHTGEIAGLSFSPDGSLLASVQVTNGRRLIVRRTSDLKTVLEYPSPVAIDTGLRFVAANGYSRVAFTSDGKHILLWAPDNLEMLALDRCLKNAMHGCLVGQLPYNKDIAIHSATNRLAYTTSKYVVFEDRGRGSLQWWWPDEEVERLFFLDDGNSVIAWTTDRILINDYEWKYEDPYKDGDLEWVFRPHTREISAGRGIRFVAVRKDRKQVAAVGTFFSLKIWDYASNTLLYDLAGPQLDLLNAVAFWPGRELVVTAGGGGSTGGHAITVWDTQHGSYVGSLLVGFDIATTALGFSDNGRYLAAGDRQGSVILWDFSVESPQAHIARPLRLTGEPPAIIAPSPSDTMMAAISRSGQLSFLDGKTGGLLAQPKVRENAGITGAFFGPDGNALYTWKTDGEVTKWDARRLLPIVSRKVLVSGGLRQVVIDPRGRRLALLDEAGRVHLGDAVTLRLSDMRFEHKTKAVTSMAFDATSAFLLSAEPNALWVWNVSSGKPQARFLDEVSTILPGSQGSLVLITNEFALKLLRDKGLRNLRQPVPSSLTTWVFSPQGARLRGHTEPVTTAAFSPDGQLLATVSAVIPSMGAHFTRGLEDRVFPQHKQSILLWNGITGERIGLPFTFSGPPITQLAFYNGSDKLVSLSAGGDVVVWNLHPTFLAQRAKAVANREFTSAERQVYFQHESALYRTLSAFHRLMRPFGTDVGGIDDTLQTVRKAERADTGRS